MIDLLLPHTDVWIAALDRQAVQPAVVIRFEEAVRARAILLAPWVRTELLGRTRDGRHFARLLAVLEGFGEVRVDAAMQIAAARHISHARARGGTVPTLMQALAWAAAERCQARIWTGDRRWLALAAEGLPVVEMERIR